MPKLVNPELGERIATCRLKLRKQLGRKISQAEFGRLIALEMGRADALSKMAVSRWESGESEPDLQTLLAIARLCHEDPGLVAFGAAAAVARLIQAGLLTDRSAVEQAMQQWQLFDLLSLTTTKNRAKKKSSRKS